MYEYRAFGEQLKKLGEGEAKYTYGGKELDDNTNLYYFNARYYDATIGRFINVDPIQDGTNWYVYCNNNPLSFVDPTGLEELIEISKTTNWKSMDSNQINNFLKTFSSGMKKEGEYINQVKDEIKNQLIGFVKLGPLNIIKSMVDKNQKSNLSDFLVQTVIDNNLNDKKDNLLIQIDKVTEKYKDGDRILSRDVINLKFNLLSAILLNTALGSPWWPVHTIRYLSRPCFSISRSFFLIWLLYDTMSTAFENFTRSMSSAA